MSARKPPFLKPEARSPKPLRSLHDDAAPFLGFADAKATFFHQLARRQDRDWYQAHKQEYEEGWARPMRALLSEVRALLVPSYPECELATGKVFRLHRDTRFSKDKAPFKTHVGGVIIARRRAPAAAAPPGSSGASGDSPVESPAAFYLQVGTETLAAAGQYSMAADALARFRAALLDDESGPELAKLVASLRKRGYQPEAMELLKKAPRGVDPGHPRVELLRHKGLIVTFPGLDMKSLTSTKLPATLARSAAKAAPLVRWLLRTTQ